MKTVFITGASSGIGKALAEEFARHNYHLILTAKHWERLEKVKADLEKNYHVTVDILIADLSKKQQVQNLCKVMMERRYGIDIAIHNAGIGYSGKFSEQSENSIENIIKLNIEAVTFLTKFFLREMKKKKQGKIINIASTGAYHPGPYTAVYYATKAYVLSLTEAVSYEEEKDNIQVIAVCPGAVRTNFGKTAGRKDNPLADAPETIARHIYKKAVKQNKKTIFIGRKYWIWVKIPRKIAAIFIGKQQKKLLLRIGK